MKKFLIILGVCVISLIIGGVLLFNMFFGPHKVKPPNGFVPDEATAIKIAEAIWLPIYGEAIYESMPFVAEYDSRRKRWYVQGSLLDEWWVGGVPEATIRKKDGKILRVSHGK